MRRALIFVVLLIILCPCNRSLYGYDKSREGIYPLGGVYNIKFYNVTLRVNTDASVYVEEVITFSFYSGNFSYAYRYINYWKIDDVINVSVGEITDNGIIWYTYGEHERGFIVIRDLSKVLIKWFYPKVIAAKLIEKTFIIRYQATAVIDAFGDKNVLDWDAVPADTPSVSSANVKVIIPKSFNIDQLEIDPVPTHIAKADNKTIITFHTNDIPAGYAFRVIVKFPRFIEPRFSWRRLWNENVISFIVITVIATVVSVIAVWYFKWRDEPVPKGTFRVIKNKYRALRYGGYVPPPRYLRPAEAVVLLRKSVSSNDIWVAMIYDFAAKGYLKIAYLGEKKIGIILTEDGKNAVLFKTKGDLRDYERDFLKLIWTIYEDYEIKGKLIENALPLTKLALELYDHRKELEKIKDEIIDTLVSRGYFRSDLRELRSTWAENYLFLAALAAFLVIIGLFECIQGLVVFGFAGMFIFIFAVPLAYMIVSNRTAKGVIAAEEAKQYSEGLLKKLEYYVTSKKERLEEALEDVIGLGIGWLIITRFGKKLIPENIVRNIKRRTHWYPEWYHHTSATQTELPSIDLKAFMTILNNAMSSFITTVSGTAGVGGIGGGGIGGGGGAGGGGAGAG